MDINRLMKFPEYRNCDFSVEPSTADVTGIMPISKDEELTRLIFAPDPQTGIPRSDLAVIMSKDAAPEIAQYIQEHLMQPLPDSVNAGDDPDLALAGIKQRDVSFDEYANGLREIAAKYEQKK